MYARIAAERTGRQARAIELDPQYVDVGIQQGWLGGSLYDTLTTDGSPWSERMWEQLRRFDR